MPPINADFQAQCTATECQGETLLLHRQRAIYWPRRHTLLVADTHLGKEQVFGRAGIAIPDGISQNGLSRLSALLSASMATRLIILGDFMHAAPSSTDCWLEQLSRFLDAHPEVAVSITAGNHDRHHGRALIDQRVQWHDSPILDGPFVLQHEPVADPRGYVLAGHLHPSWRLGHRRAGVRAPAFWFQHRCAVLPAFGHFTGGARIDPARGDKLFMVGPDCVLPVPPASALSSCR